MMTTRVKLTLLTCCVALALVSCVTRGAEAPLTLEEVLAAMPARTPEDGERLSKNLCLLGDSAVRKACAVLLPPGEGDDIQARYAVSGLAKYVSLDGRESDRVMVSRALIKALDDAKDNEVKAFLIRQLQVAGKEEAVEPLSAYLADERLCEPATQALLAIGSKSASKALAAALQNATDANQLTLIKACGEMRNDSLLGQLAEYASSSDADTRRAAWFALAGIANPVAAPILEKASNSPGRYDRSRGTAFYLKYAARRAEDGGKAGKAECSVICRKLYEMRDREPSVQSAALSVLVACEGKDALDDVVAAMDSDSKALRAAALKLANTFPGRGATMKWVAKMAEVGPEARAEIAYMLSNRGDEAALPAILALLDDEDASVRLVAVDSSVRLGKEKALDALLALLAGTSSDDEVAAAKAALLRVPGAAAMAKMADALAETPAAGRVVLLEVLAARRASAHKDAVFAQAEDADESVRLAAIRALGNLTCPDDLPRLVALLVAGPGDKERAEATKVVVTIAKRVEDSEKRADAVLAALPETSGAPRAALLGALSGIGGARGMAAVVAETKASDDVVKDAAIRALADWPGDEALPELLKLADSAEALPHQVLALRGYIRLVGASGTAAAEKVAMYEKALATAKRPDEKKAVLSGLSSVRCAESLALVDECLADESLSNEAALAAVAIACPKDENDAGLAGPEVARTLKKAMPLVDEAIANKIALHLGTMPGPDDEGFVPLFNGKNLDGWVGDTKGYVAENQTLVCQPGGNLYTENEYGDFILRFEFKLPPGGNNGLAVRAPIGGGAYNGMELQILDNSAEKYKDLKPYQYHGSMYGMAPAKRGFQKPVGEWNVQEVTAKGRQITVKLNGAVILDANIDEASTPETMDGKEHKGLDLEKGHLGFLGHGDRVEFRNIRIKELN